MRNSKDEFQAANPQQIPTQITTVAPPKLVLPEIEPEVAPEQHEALDPEVQKPRVDPWFESLGFKIGRIS